MDPDPYGIPESVFGPLDPELPALIGRIVMLSALLESKVDSLASSLTRELQSVTAGRPFASNLRACREGLVALAGRAGRARDAAAIASTLDDVEAALRARNDVAHRVWPHAGVSGWGGWKPTPVARRDKITAEWSDWKGFARADLIEDLERLIRLVKEMGNALASAG